MDTLTGVLLAVGLTIAGLAWRLLHAPRRQVRPRLLIRYDNGAGAITERQITPHEVLWQSSRHPGGGGAYLAGYCHLRREPRTFRLDRIVWAADARTGEVIDDVLAHLGVPPRRKRQRVYRLPNS